VALPASTVREFERWASLAMSGRWVFPTEGGGPGNRDSFWRHSIAPRLKKKGLDWLNFQVMRRTWTSLAAGAGIDPKVRADQLGHGVDVDINTYTQTDFSAKLAAVTVVEGLLNGSGSEAVQ
jgi:integrase